MGAATVDFTAVNPIEARRQLSAACVDSDVDEITVLFKSGDSFEVGGFVTLGEDSRLQSGTLVRRYRRGLNV